MGFRGLASGLSLGRSRIAASASRAPEPAVARAKSGSAPPPRTPDPQAPCVRSDPDPSRVQMQVLLLRLKATCRPRRGPGAPDLTAGSPRLLRRLRPGPGSGGRDPGRTRRHRGEGGRETTGLPACPRPFGTLALADPLPAAPCWRWARGHQRANTKARTRTRGLGHADTETWAVPARAPARGPALRGAGRGAHPAERASGGVTCAAR